MNKRKLAVIAFSILAILSIVVPSMLMRQQGIQVTSQSSGIFPAFYDRLIPLNGSPNPALQVNSDGAAVITTDGAWIGRDTTNNVAFNTTSDIVTMTAATGGDLHLIGRASGPDLIVGRNNVIENTHNANPVSSAGSYIFGDANTIDTPNTFYSSIFGGRNHTMSNSGSLSGSALVGGSGNTIGSSNSFIGGGATNEVGSSNNSAIVGGTSNSALIGISFIGGGSSNTLSAGAGGENAIIGGDNNSMNGATKDSAAMACDTCTINNSEGSQTIAGDNLTVSNSDNALVQGNLSSATNANYAVALGRRADIDHSGTFVFADGINADCDSDHANQFKVCASGGVTLSTATGGVTDTLWLSPAVWEDLNFNVAILRGGSNPDLISFDSGNIQIAAFDGGASLEEVNGWVEYPHSGLEGAIVLKPHAHIFPTDANAGNITFWLEYDIREDDTVFASGTISATTAASGTAWDEQFLALPNITIANAIIGMQIGFRLYRDPAYSTDTYGSDVAMSTFGIHYQNSTLGTTSVGSK